MFRGRWGIFVAIVGLALLAGLLSASYSLYNAAQQQHPSYGYQPASKPGVRLDGVTKAPTQHYKPSCQNPNSREDADLCAQWAAVDQVAESNRIASVNARLAILTLLVTVFGTGLLLWTFDETRETSRRELRAYITVEKVRRLSADKDRFHGFIDYVNRGATPAYVVDIAYRAWVAEPNLASPFQTGPAPRSQALTKKVVGKDEGDSVRIGVTKKTVGGTEFLRDMIKEDRELYVYGWIIYFDVFRSKHHTFFSYIPPAHVTDVLKEFVPTIKGNAAD